MLTKYSGMQYGFGVGAIKAGDLSCSRMKIQGAVCATLATPAQLPRFMLGLYTNHWENLFYFAANILDSN